MSASLRPRHSAAPARVWLVGWGLVAACLPSKPLHDYARENGGSAGAAAGGAAGGAGGVSGAGGTGAAGQAGSASEAPRPGDDAGARDGGPPPADAGITITPDAALLAAGCAVDERLGPDQRCYFIDATATSWADARTACQTRGADWDLARVRSADQSVFLGDELTFEAWIGASDAASEGQWVWVGDVLPFWIGNGMTGAPNGDAYTNWNATEPNGATATNCARALPRSSGSVNPNAPWADIDCAQLLGSVCESGPRP